MRSAPKADTIRVLLVDDKESFLKMACETLITRGCEVATAGSAQEAVEQLETKFFDVVVSDVRMPDMDGLTLLRKLRTERPTLQVVMLSGHATVEMAIEAMKLGAFDFFLKPFKADDLMRTIQRAAERGWLERRNIALEEELERTKGSGLIVGASETTEIIQEFIEIAASSDLPVLITGETGTGKELVARAIHERSRRSGRPLVVVDGSTLREELLASELFGHEKGAFTGALRKKVGLFEVADQGSIFFDEIGEISPVNQSSLLRVMESGVFRPVGAVRETSADVRIIAATNRDIKNALKAGKFREDLYHRLNGLSFLVPPLREHPSDIPLLAEHFLAVANRNAATRLELSEEAIAVLVSYDWPGNVRELKYVIERAALLARKEPEIKSLHLPDDIRGGKKIAVAETPTSGWSIHVPQEKPTLAELRSHCERDYILRLLREFNGNKSQVARVIGMSRSKFYEKLHRLGINQGGI